MCPRLYLLLHAALEGGQHRVMEYAGNLTAAQRANAITRFKSGAQGGSSMSSARPRADCIRTAKKAVVTEWNGSKGYVAGAEFVQSQGAVLLLGAYVVFAPCSPA